MNVRSGRLLDPGKRGYIVGGEPDKSGDRIPTTYVPAESFGEQHVLSAREDLRRQTGDSRVNLGAWANGENIELDASRTAPRPSEALRKGRNRGELEIWDNRRMRGIKVTPKDRGRSR